MRGEKCVKNGVCEILLRKIGEKNYVQWLKVVIFDISQSPMAPIALPSPLTSLLADSVGQTPVPVSPPSSGYSLKQFPSTPTKAPTSDGV